MKKQFILGVIAVSMLLAACNQQQSAGAAASGAAAASGVPAGLESDSKQLGYILGYEFATSAQLGMLKNSGIEVDIAALTQAINDQIAGKPSQISQEQQQALVKTVSEKLQAAAAKAASEAVAKSEKFLSENKTKEGVKVTASGLQYKVKKEGTGPQVAMGDGVMVQYEGRLPDGTVFDGPNEHGNEPIPFPMKEGTVIKGWTEGLQLMKEGGEYTLYIPAELAYGAQSPTPKIPANSALVFDIKIAKVEKGAADPKSAPVQK
ncbi:FKBP-type peptidyl-prolyl cis-trans isomerase [Kingella negevensis]|uniref:Peptidyl-prolyl cis-trans isomerase n=1 Tax=Kingella negevensis TaxID=1522312 RepID=A0A238HIB4_9NEIS|nr:FKBP-type peptidyl-prolyl cis-trans isomerase [Kingella negevensis]MDK4680887.1 FKBP-type peptidyl-prolyl cis-trans isomerase [Kingella negevensis]MDK4681390.1 FKBP-type peptidyl-prolyl cis-trans isomerase [Kingella negevensis]MDK4691777.1 FKBP-type peptidyl-prolyl cis-trans isomerase [Kingella negevensis]MDK4693070.1 FKBP-type peptidyl-prolyl cis-trans isomerase [Kingella negevensis]MDK4698061.1 FKBP-type peptidyl-prolyl cis-trans isomerase [Kingella negevensis]